MLHYARAHSRYTALCARVTNSLLLCPPARDLHRLDPLIGFPRCAATDWSIYLNLPTYMEVIDSLTTESQKTISIPLDQPLAERYQTFTSGLITTVL